MNLTVDQIRILLSGLKSLEGALGALNQPLPHGIPELRNALQRQEQAEEQVPAGYLTTRQVAERLGCSIPWVRHLAKKGEVRLAKRGKRGRGFSSRYEEKSVEAYLKKIRDTPDNRRGG